MSIQENITREEISHRGGGVELDLSGFGYEDEYLSAYQNYLGDGMRGAVANSCTVEDWEMDERLYDDKLAGDITKERYETKHKSILEQIQTVKDDLSIADSTSAQRHEEAIDLIKLTQTAKDEYLDSDITSEAKRSILTELFESVTLKDNSVSVKYTFFAESVAKRSRKTKEIIEGKICLTEPTKITKITEVK